MVSCKICGHGCKSYGSLSKHIRDQHKEYNSRLYYDTFVKETNADKCQVCGNNTAFINLNHGYSKTCNHKCGGIWHRKQLKHDEGKHRQFIKKVADNQIKIWSDRKVSGEIKKISNKIRNTIKKSNSSLTKDELKDRYGWLNRLSESDKRAWIDSVQTKTGMYVWWQKASEDEKQKIIDQRNASKLGISLDEYYARNDDLDEFEKYRGKVWLLTEQTYKKHKDIIDPENKRSPKFHLDHKFSVVRGFQSQILPEIVASVYNLEILPSYVNCSKGGKCSLTAAELEKLYHG